MDTKASLSLARCPFPSSKWRCSLRIETRVERVMLVIASHTFGASGEPSIPRFEHCKTGQMSRNPRAPAAMRRTTAIVTMTPAQPRHRQRFNFFAMDPYCFRFHFCFSRSSFQLFASKVKRQRIDSIQFPYQTAVLPSSGDREQERGK